MGRFPTSGTVPHQWDGSLTLTLTLIPPVGKGRENDSLHSKDSPPVGKRDSYLAEHCFLYALTLISKVHIRGTIWSVGLSVAHSLGGQLGFTLAV